MKKEEFAEKIYEGISDLNPEFMEEALNDHPDHNEQKDHMDEKDLVMDFGEQNGNGSGSEVKTDLSKRIFPWRKWAAAAAGICVMAVGIKAYNTYFKPLTPEMNKSDTNVNNENLQIESVETVQVETSEQNGKPSEQNSNADEGGNTSEPNSNIGEGGNTSEPNSNIGEGGNTPDDTSDKKEGKDQELSEENKATLTAKDIGDIFSSYEMNDRSAVATTSYSVSTFSVENDPKTLGLFKLPEFPDYMEIYRIKQKEVNLDAFGQFVKQYYSTAMDFVGLQGPKDPPEIEKRDYSGMCTSMYSDYSSDYYRSVLGITRRNCYEMQMSDNGRFQFDGKMVEILPTDTDEQIKEKIQVVLDRLEKAFGKRFSDYKIDRTYGGRNRGLSSVTIKIYDADHAYHVNDLIEYDYEQEYYTLYFYVDSGYGTSFEWNDDSGNAYLTKIIYGRTAYPYEEYIQNKGVLRTLTLEEAEEMLYKGYVFGGHSCPLCMQMQAAVDFSGYDGVTFSYISGGDSLGYQDEWFVPFYKFYKKLPCEDPDKVRYAVTYVCAVEVEGMDEYFKEQEKNHRGSVVSDIDEVFR